MGADEDVAAEVASHLVRSNLSGHDSQGVMRMAQYVRQFDSRILAPSARPVVSREAGILSRRVNGSCVTVNVAPMQESRFHITWRELTEIGEWFELQVPDGLT